MNNMAKNLLLWLLIAAVLLSVFNNFNLRSSTEQVGYSEFINEVQTDRLSKVLVDGLTITAQRKDGSSFETIRPMVEDPKLMDDASCPGMVVATPDISSNSILAVDAGCKFASEELKSPNLAFSCLVK